MAKWGEGDERWRVNNLGAEGRNVNAWHWVEKDSLPWCKQRLAKLLVGVNLCPGGGGADAQLRTTALSKVEGEAVVNNRKKKIIAAYELDIRVDWEGSVGGEAVRGSIRLPYVSEENHDEDPELQVTTPNDSPASREAKEAILMGGKQALHNAIATFVKELRAGGPMREGASAAEAEEAAAATAAPSAVAGAAPAGVGAAAGQPQQQPADQAGSSSAAAAAPAKLGGVAAAAAAPAAAGSGSGHSIKLKERFYASAGDLYECFTDPRRIMAFTQSPAEAQPTPGGKLSMFGGSVQGEFRELQPPTRIVMGWRFSNWEDGAMSQVTLDIDEKEKGNTLVRLTQTGIPDADRFGNHDVVGTTEAGWKNQVFHRIRTVFGYGVGL